VRLSPWYRPSPVPALIASSYRIAYKTTGCRSNIEFWRAFLVSPRRVGLGLVVNSTITILCAYPLSKPAARFPARKYYAAFFMVAMLFHGGLIPTCIRVAKTGITGSVKG
jgi:ABC-type glycerol-3-phosphate transport system permease component